MIPSRPASADGTLNGTTPVTVVAAPASGSTRSVRFVNVHNRDTASITITFQLLNGSDVRILEVMTLAAGAWWRFGTGGELLFLDTTGKSLQIKMSGAPATTQPDWMSTWGDFT